MYTKQSVYKLLVMVIWLTSTDIYASESSKYMDSYFFDENMLRGGMLSKEMLKRFNDSDEVAPGLYDLDIYINGRFVRREPVDILTDNTHKSPFCLSPEQWLTLGLAPDRVNKSSCSFLEEVAPSADYNLELEELKLSFDIPQVLLNSVPRGYVSPDRFDEGESMLFMSYVGNYYHVSYEDNNLSSQDNMYFSMAGGINSGLWQLRQISNASYSNDGITEWNNIRTYVQRPMYDIGSQLIMGQTYTTGLLLSGLGYNGISLSTDERMLPDSLKGYAPTVRGIAKSNARVAISQNGREIYQTTVAPGQFEISDLYPSSYNGDLTVTVYEADGEVSTFLVPFSSVPNSLREGAGRYSVSLGETRDTEVESYFGDFVYQYGLSNSVTLNSGVRLADGYQALVNGGVYTSSIGAFGADLTYSHANIPHDGYVHGWMGHISYSKTITETNTNISIAGYRYSTPGYRDLGDVLGSRAKSENGGKWTSSTYEQQSRFDISLSQSLGHLGNVFISGSTQNYHSDRKRESQLQAGYGYVFTNGASVNLSILRQDLGGYNNSLSSDVGYSSISDIDLVTSISVSYPLGQANNSLPTLNMSYSHSDITGGQYQTSLSGTIDDNKTLSYDIGVTGAGNNTKVWNGGISKTFSKAATAINLSSGDEYWQASGNIQGGIVLHENGITFGQYLGDTFALIEAKGANGAKILNTPYATIDNSGYALVSSLVPYKVNSIAIDSQDISDNVEIIEWDGDVVPYSGATTKLSFETITGIPIVIRTHLSNGDSPPLGADVLEDGKDKVIGIVGQAGQIYFRTERKAGRLSVRWGEGKGQSCSIDYAIPGDAESSLVRIERTCS
ncbi:TPA: fimbria/pilus outer membrane usher protein [Aeromonas veronii]